MSKHGMSGDLWDDEPSWGGRGSGSTYKRCYESHKPLAVGDGLLVWGGSCSSPIVADADIYVGLDMSHKKSAKAYPWEAGGADQGQEESPYRLHRWARTNWHSAGGSRICDDGQDGCHRVREKELLPQGC